MVHFTRYISAAALITATAAAPMDRRQYSGSGYSPSQGAQGAYGGSSWSPSPPPPQGAKGAYGGSSWSGSSYSPPQGAQGAYGGNAWSSQASPSTMMVAAASVATSSATMMMSSETAMASATQSMWSSVAMASPSSSAMYGSGSSSWGGSGSGSGYNNCVQQCAASFGQPSMTWTPSATQASAPGGVSGTNGVTHTVIVAPTEGVLRYIPFSTNASVGDTVSFVWGAGPHTVTSSSALEVCNKTTGPGSFASGMQNKGFTFNQVVNNTNPIWFYCGVPTHCQKGMFGGINIGQADPTGGSSMPSGNVSSPSSTMSSYMPLSSMMPNITSMTPEMGALWSYTQTKTSGNPYASSWGMTTNCAGMTPDAMMQTAENVMYMQTLIAANPNAMQGGKFTVTSASNLTVPPDLQQALAASGPSNATSAGAAASGTGTSAVGTPSAAPSKTPSNGAASVASSSVVVGLVAVVATFLAL